MIIDIEFSTQMGEHMQLQFRQATCFISTQYFTILHKLTEWAVQILILWLQGLEAKIDMTCFVYEGMGEVLLSTGDRSESRSANAALSREGESMNERPETVSFGFGKI